MKIKFTFLSVLLVCLCLSVLLRAQTPSDAAMMKQGEICIAMMYENSWFDHYWEGTYLRTNGTIATVKRNMVMPMAAVGIFDKLNLLVSVPYIQTESTEPNGGHFKGAKGIQDLGLALKAELVRKQLGAGRLFFLTTAGFSTPISNYLSDYRPYSIGFGAPEVSFRGILQYQLDNGIYARGALAYLWRGQTEAEREYYYNNGSYYTPWMDVPSAWNYNAVAGILLFNNTLKLEANYMGLASTSGDDIRPYNAAQPTNKVNADQVGLTAQYYFKKPKGLGLWAYGSQVVNGRNTGKSTQIGGAVTYQFRFLNRSNSDLKN